MMQYKNIEYEGRSFKKCIGYNRRNPPQSTLRLHPDTCSIERNAFESLWSFRNVEFPENLEVIKDYAFYYTAIKDLIINHKIRLKAHCFEKIRSKNVKLETETIPEACFKDSALENIELKDTVILKSDSFNKASIESFSFPDTLRTIESRAFYDCKLKTNVFKVPDSVRRIKDYALYFENVDTIILPENLEYLDPCFARENVIIVTNLDTINRFPCLKHFNTKVSSIEELIDRGHSFKQINDFYKNTFIER